MSNFTPAPVKPAVELGALDRLDIRVGTIVKVETVGSSRKLCKLTVSFGDHSRSILAGIRGERDDPQEIEGIQALFLINLAPKEMAGETSQGMLLDVGYADDLLPALLLPERKVPDGTRAG